MMKHSATCALLLLVAALGQHAATAYTVSDARVANVMALTSKFPELSQQAKYSKMLNGFAEYLGDSDLVCTTVAPSNEAIAKTMKSLGRYMGLFLQNKTMQTEVFNYHVIEQQRYPLQRLLKSNVTATLTRANQTLWFVRRGDQLYAVSRPDFLVPLKIVNITTGGCVTHTVDELLIPPNLMPVFDRWMKEAGHTPAPLPRDQWVLPLTPAPGATEAPYGSNYGKLTGEKLEQQTAAAAAAPSAPTPAPAAPASSSAGQGQQASGACWAALAAVAAIQLALRH